MRCRETGMSNWGWKIALAMGLCVAGSADAVDVDGFLRKSQLQDIKLSPDGKHYAATKPYEDYTALAIVRRSDNQVTAKFRLGKNSHVDDFWWVGAERVLFSLAEKIGSLDEPQPMGELYVIAADGKAAKLLAGPRLWENSTTSDIKTKHEERIAVRLIDERPHDADTVLIETTPLNVDSFTRAERMNLRNGYRTVVARAPVPNATFTTDNRGQVRFASGVGTDNVRKLFYRPSDEAEWMLVGDELRDGGIQWPLGFSADDRTAYLQVEHAEGTDSILALDVESGSRRQVARDPNVDPDAVIYRAGGAVPVGVRFMDGRSRTEFFDEGSPEARMQRALEKSFPGSSVTVRSHTSDGAFALVQVGSDRNPGDFYLFDTAARRVEYLMSRQEWIEPDAMAEMKPIHFTSRDGVALHGYLTLPAGRDDRDLPTVVVPHGGPFGVRDRWTYDPEVQLLAAAGYAVLQINFRGSGGYGQAYMEAGARQWGGMMQDDLTDATRWAIEQGIADRDRICIYGASYGGYAALMGAAKEPALYRCAAGYVGVYDLQLMQSDDSKFSRRVARWSSQWVGAGAALDAVSPNHLANRIRIPVFLAAGGLDERAPVEHTRRMEKALRSVGSPVEALYFATEGHGFYLEKNRRVYYTRLLAFLSTHLGGETISASRPN